MSSNRDDLHDDGELAARIVELLRSAAAGAWSAGRWSIASVIDGVDQAVAPVVARRVRSAIDSGGVGAGRRDVERALRSARERSVGRSVAGRALPRVARRLAPVRAATRRSPVGMALWVGPGLVEAVSIGVAEIDAVASHLGVRARRAGVAPGVEAIHAATVAVLAGRSDHVEPGSGPDHGPLLRTWVAAGAGSVVPFGLAGRRRPIDEICDRLEAIADDSLGGGPRRLGR